MKLFFKNKIYSFEKIANICERNGLVTVDCLKDENIISVEEYDNGELGGECMYEFVQIENSKFKLRWEEVQGIF